MDAVSAGAAGDGRTALLQLYDTALPQVYGYVLARCSRRETAEELTSETFLAAADAARRTPPPGIDLAWLIGVARHKLVDHWRRQAREERNPRAAAADPVVQPSADDPPPQAGGAPGSPEHLDAMRAAQTLDNLAPQHRLALTLRYVDDLPVAEVAALLERTLHATEALLVRARAAFRAEYTATETGEDGHA